MKKKFLFFVFLLSTFCCLDIYSLSLLPFDRDREKQRYIFRTIERIDRNPVWLFCLTEEGTVLVRDEIEQSHGITEEEIDEIIDLSFTRRGINPKDWFLDWNERRGDATFSTQLTFAGKMVILDAGLFCEAMILESQVFVPGIIWKKRLLVNLEGKEPFIKEVIAMHLEALIGEFLDAYIDAVSHPEDVKDE